jgi:hypothetical protein
MSGNSKADLRSPQQVRLDALREQIQEARRLQAKKEQEIARLLMMPTKAKNGSQRSTPEIQAKRRTLEHLRIEANMLRRKEWQLRFKLSAAKDER